LETTSGDGEERKGERARERERRVFMKRGVSEREMERLSDASEGEEGSEAVSSDDFQSGFDFEER
jgi:siroheme synthase (precorrin-2 oxidase/ferrochelatase)